jgi:hypothetical protein
MLAAILHGIRHAGVSTMAAILFNICHNSNDVLFSVSCGEETARGVLTSSLHREAQVNINNFFASDLKKITYGDLWCLYTMKQFCSYTGFKNSVILAQCDSGKISGSA